MQNYFSCALAIKQSFGLLCHSNAIKGVARMPLHSAPLLSAKLKIFADNTATLENNF